MPAATSMQVRLARIADRQPLLELWERSVRATHHFLQESDIVALRPLVAQELGSDAVDWWVLLAPTRDPIGFLGFANDTVEALFIDPDYQGQGGGKRLIAQAESLASGPLSVEVNEQNEGALRFYQSLGFSVVSRSPTDSGGRPFPILHLKRSSRPNCAR
jgi:putative acetyltransferase